MLYQNHWSFYLWLTNKLKSIFAMNCTLDFCVSSDNIDFLGPDYGQTELRGNFATFDLPVRMANFIAIIRNQPGHLNNFSDWIQNMLEVREAIDSKIEDVLFRSSRGFPNFESKDQKNE